MKYIIENEELRAEVDSFGAQLISLIDKKSKEEMLWGADPAYWNETSPLLFPFIGKLKDFRYTHEGREYSTTKHGFAKNMEFEEKLGSAECLVLALESSPKTLENYPFQFRLEVEFRLEGSALNVGFQVFHEGEDIMYFSIGGHPGFLCPPGREAHKGLRRTDCCVKLHGAEKAKSIENLCVSPDGLLSGTTIPLDVREGIIPVREHTFDTDALLIEKQGVYAVGICDSTGQEYVRVESQAPVWGIWSVADTNAGYICIEPWFGVCDRVDFAGSLKERPLQNQASEGKPWKGGYRIVVL